MRDYRIGHRQTFPQKILNFGLYKRQHDLSIRRQADHTNVMSQKIIACCVDCQELKVEGMNYIENNMALAADVVTFIDLLNRIYQGNLKSIY